jgi:hypothetical protein
MDRERKARITPLLIGIAIPLLLVAYVASYLALADRKYVYTRVDGNAVSVSYDSTDGGEIEEVYVLFAEKWQEILFSPVGQAESLARGLPVTVRSLGPVLYDDPEIRRNWGWHY